MVLQQPQRPSDDRIAVAPPGLMDATVTLLLLRR